MRRLVWGGFAARSSTPYLFKVEWNTLNFRTLYLAARTSERGREWTS